VDELEHIAKKYIELKHKQNNKQSELSQFAKSIVDAISLPSFSFPLKEEAQVASGTTTYVYENSATFPALYEFFAELLHSKVPLEIRDTKFGPGEIIINKENKGEADAELDASVKELQKLVHGKRSEMLSKHRDST